MPTIAEVRQQYPQYSDMSDADLAGALHTKFYSDLPREEFDKKVGLAPEDTPKKKFGLGDTWPAKLAKGVYDAVTLPGDVAQGKVSMVGEDGHTNPEVINRSAELASVASPISPAARIGVGWAGALKTKEAPAPTQEALAKAAGEGYDKARNLGVDLPASGVSDLAERIGQHLQNDKGITADTAEKTFKALDRIKQAPDDAIVTVPNLDALRQHFGEIAGNFNQPTDQKAAIIAKQHLADYVASLTDQDAIRGPASEVSKITKDANANYAASKRGGQIADALDKAELQTAATHSGRNLDNKTRQAFVKLLTDDKAGAGYTTEELAQAERIVRGSKTADLMRSTGNFLGGGGGMGMLHGSSMGAGAGALVGGPLGAAVGAAAVPGVGYALKKGADASTMRAVDKLAKMTRRRSPLGQSMPDRMVAEVDPRRAALARALMLGATPQQ